MINLTPNLGSFNFSGSIIPPLQPLGSEPLTNNSGPIYETMPDGTKREVDVIIVTAKRTDPYKALMPYGGLTGAEENGRRDAEFANMSPEDRAIALGMNPFDSLDVARDENDTVGEDPLVQEIADILPLELKGEAARLALEAAAEELSNSIENAQLGRAGENAVRAELAINGWQEVGQQVRMLIMDDEGKWGVRIYDFLARNDLGQLTFLEVKTNGAERSARQRKLDDAFMQRGGLVATSRLTPVGLPSGSAMDPAVVGVVKVRIERRI